LFNCAMSGSISAQIDAIVAENQKRTDERIAELKERFRQEDEEATIKREQRLEQEKREREAWFVARRYERMADARRSTRIGLLPFNRPAPDAAIIALARQDAVFAKPGVPAIVRLEGPVSMTHHFDPKTGLHVYVLGDVHDKIPGQGCGPPLTPLSLTPPSTPPPFPPIQFLPSASQAWSSMSTSITVQPFSSVPAPTAVTAAASTSKTTSSTVSVADFFSVLAAAHSDVVIDFYLESDYVARGGKRNPKIVPHGYLFEDVLSRYDKCLQPEKKLGCPIPNARFHYVDVRSLLPPAVNDYLNAMRFLDETWEQVFDPELGDPNNPFHFLAFALSQKYDDQGKSWFEHVLGLKTTFPLFRMSEQLGPLRISKQWGGDRLDPVTVRDIEHYFVGSYYLPPFSTVEWSVTRLQELMPKGKSEVVSGPQGAAIEDEIKLLQEIAQRYLTATASLMDAYTAARMFRLAKTGGKYAVVYAGEAHVENLRGFFDYQGFQRIATAKPIRQQCLDLQTFHQPFFPKPLPPKPKYQFPAKPF
jgi:hypothetical protein